MSPIELEPNSNEAARLLGALANKKRLIILAHLYEGELSVTTLATRVELSQSALSQHLAKLRKLRIVSTRRQGQTIYYSAICKRTREIIHTVCNSYSAA